MAVFFSSSSMCRQALRLLHYTICWGQFFSRLAEPDVVVAGPDGGEGPEGEGALDLAHVVLEDVLGAERLGQVEAVLDLQRSKGREADIVQCVYRGSSVRINWCVDLYHNVNLLQSST